MKTTYTVYDSNDRIVKQTSDSRYAQIVCARFMGNYVLVSY